MSLTTVPNQGLRVKEIWWLPKPWVIFGNTVHVRSMFEFRCAIALANGKRLSRRLKKREVKS